jgi:hypothetical protein
MSEPLWNPAEYGPEIRYSSCLVLENIGIPYVIWFEDALAHYGVPTIVFDLYVLVLDIDTAAELLLKLDGSLIPKTLIGLGIQS